MSLYVWVTNYMSDEYMCDRHPIIDTRESRTMCVYMSYGVCDFMYESRTIWVTNIWVICISSWILVNHELCVFIWVTKYVTWYMSHELCEWVTKTFVTSLPWWDVYTCRGMLQCVAVCCSLLQCLLHINDVFTRKGMLQRVAARNTYRWCIYMWRDVARVAACCSVLQRVAACCSLLQRVASCCSVLQRVAARITYRWCVYM